MINRRYSFTRIVTPATSMALVTLDQAKVSLGIDLLDTSQDAAIQQQIDIVSMEINNYCARIFVVQAYQDRLRYVVNYLCPGDPLRTRQKPIVEDAGVPVVTVAEDGATIDPSLWEVSSDEGLLYRLNGTMVGSWTGTTILINYTAGFDPIPPDVQGAALDWLRSRWSAKGRDPAIRSETANDVASFTYFDWSGSGAMEAGAPPNAARILRPYQLIAI